ncbi:hypothetical protein NPX13_g10515 [Xylaria arbuscula]|uniref:DAGKc domain-containing protein n=1 Tax=Xylaria arbuscula TaxID=114810 RepID=A0A9W8N4M6_9PEZI|nr:hypothetical protein NPX13_g10515 [Xylaria arbuscula]
MAELQLQSQPPVDAAAPVKLIVGGMTLFLDADGLKILEGRDSHDRRKSRFCGIQILPGTFSTTIPYYNILWASADSEKLVIEWAEEKSEGKLRHATLNYAPIRDSAAETETFVASLRDRAYGQVPRNRRAMVLINPHAGPGGAARIWENDVRPIFEAARMTLDTSTPMMLW